MSRGCRAPLAGLAGRSRTPSPPSSFPYRILAGGPKASDLRVLSGPVRYAPAVGSSARSVLGGRRPGACPKPQALHRSWSLPVIFSPLSCEGSGPTSDPLVSRGRSRVRPGEEITLPHRVVGLTLLARCSCWSGRRSLDHDVQPRLTGVRTVSLGLRARLPQPGKGSPLGLLDPLDLPRGQVSDRDRPAARELPGRSGPCSPALLGSAGGVGGRHRGASSSTPRKGGVKDLPGVALGAEGGR